MDNERKTGEPAESIRMPGEPDKEQILKWTAQYGKGNVIRLEGEVLNDDPEADSPTQAVVVYCRKPNAQHMARFTTLSRKDSYKAIADMVLDCRLWPDAETLKQRFESQPGLVLGLGGELQEVAGSTANFTVKRF